MAAGKENFNHKAKINSFKFLSFLKKNYLTMKSVGGYYPSNFEADVLEILEILRLNNYKISLPVIKKNNKMDFFEWSKNEPLKINKYGILESTSFKKIYPDILLIPLVAYDCELNRLGYGGGYYDRYIEKIMKKKSIIKIGIAYSIQKLRKIPISTHDQKLDYIFTEKDEIL